MKNETLMFNSRPFFIDPAIFIHGSSPIYFPKKHTICSWKRQGKKAKKVSNK